MTTKPTDAEWAQAARDLAHKREAYWAAKKLMLRSESDYYNPHGVAYRAADDAVQIALRAIDALYDRERTA